MSVRIGINGFGRISRTAIRAAMQRDDIDIRAINVRNADLEYLEYMLRYDSTFGRFPKELGRYENGLLIDGKQVPVYSCENAEDIPWGESGAEYIIDGTGAYVTTEKAMAHIRAGAKKVIISAPAKDDVTPTFVMGVNNDKYESSMQVVSNASCTTNCLAPIIKVLEDNFGIEHGLMSTIHAATAKQKVVDMRSAKDWRTGRCSFNNIIPSTTGAAKAVGLVIPSVKGKMTGISYRVPVADVSVIDVNVLLKTDTTYAEICQKMKEASETYLKGVLEYVDDEVVSSDFVGDPCTSIFDAREGLSVHEKLFKLIGFYDNEYGYATKLLELAAYMSSVDSKAKQTVRDFDVSGKRVLMRCDFNVPMQDGVITDDKRIEETLPTLRYLIEQGARVVMMSHLGRPKGNPNPKFSLAPVAKSLSEKLQREVRFAASDRVVDENVMNTLQV